MLYCSNCLLTPVSELKLCHNPTEEIALNSQFQVPAYLGMPLNRNSALRENPEWVEQQKNFPGRWVTAIYNDANLISKTINGSLAGQALFNGKYAEILLGSGDHPTYLGHHGELPVFGTDLSRLSQMQIDLLIEQSEYPAELLDLRKSVLHLVGDDAAICAYSRGLAFWHRENQHCSRCGSPNQVHSGGHMRKCSNESCAKEAYPRIDPAVIMIVELADPPDGIPKCLLGRHKGLPIGIYSTLAGFVEPGESLEEAVAREVMEEAGVQIDSARYVGSQPWPFPSSLMLGYRATTRQWELNVDLDELEDARWFSVEEINNFGEYDQPDSLALPRKDSISRTLIESWLGDNQ